jgi:hypothetical protein
MSEVEPFDVRNSMFLDASVPTLTGLGDFVTPGGKRAVNFNGTDTVLYRSTALANVVKSNKYLFSIWFKSTAQEAGNITDTFVLWMDTINGSGLPDAGSSNEQVFTAGNLLGGPSGIGWNVFFQDTGFTAADAYVYVLGAGGFHFDGNWHNMIFAGDTNHVSGARIEQVVFDGTLVSHTADPSNFGAAFLIDFTFPGVAICSGGFNTTTPNSMFETDIAEVYINTRETLDMTVGANILKLRDGVGRPMNLGSDGHVPTGNPPAFYLSLGATAADISFAVDKSGNGNDFIISGALVRATTDPF